MTLTDVLKTTILKCKYNAINLKDTADSLSSVTEEKPSELYVVTSLFEL